MKKAFSPVILALALVASGVVITEAAASSHGILARTSTTHLSIDFGSGQSATVSTSYDALAVEVTRANGTPVAHSVVEFSAPTSGATVTFQHCAAGYAQRRHSCSVYTNSSGIALAFRAVASDVTGRFSVLVEDHQATNTVHFTLKNLARGVPVNSTSAFFMQGRAIHTLLPGTTSPIDVTFINPTNHPIVVVGSSLQITVASSATSCPVSPPGGPANFTIPRGLGVDVAVPAHNVVSLGHQYRARIASWPVIAMNETGRNQDPCQGVVLALSLRARSR